MAMRIWGPLTVAVLGRWTISALNIATASLIAFAVSAGGGQDAPVTPAWVMHAASLDGAEGRLRAAAWALALTVVAAAVETLAAWTATWSHARLTDHVTSSAIRALLAPNRTRVDALDPATIVQRWLLKVELVQLFHDGGVNLLGALGTVVLALGATFGVDWNAGCVGAIGVLAGCVHGYLVGRRSLAASRAAALEHERVGALLRVSAQVGETLGRPSEGRRWMERTAGARHALVRRIRAEGFWGSILYGGGTMIATATPLVGFLALADRSSVAAGVAVFLFLSRLTPSLCSVAASLPLLQGQLVSLERTFAAFSRYEGDRDAPERARSPERVLVKDVEVRYELSRVALRYPTLELRRGTLSYVVGRSGGGKSSLLRVIAGRDVMAGGSLQADDDRVDPMTSAWRETCALLPQEPFLEPGCLDDDERARWDAREATRAALGAILGGASARPTATGGTPQLSVGQRRAVCVLRTLGSGAPVILLDEPFAGIDDALLVLLRPAISAALRAGSLVLVACHEHDIGRLGMEGRTYALPVSEPR